LSRGGARCGERVFVNLETSPIASSAMIFAAPITRRHSSFCAAMSIRATRAASPTAAPACVTE
jgi:hypothetical protein